jgi:dipeptidase E
MSVILASDFPSCANPRIVERIGAAAPRPRIAWIAAETATGRLQFAESSQQFAALGFDNLEYCDIDEETDEVQLAYLYEFDVIYLSGGDPLQFRANMLRTGLSGRLRQCGSLGRLIVASGGGALLLTPNVSVHRLHAETVEEVLATRSRFDGMGAVAYEVLLHANRCEAEFLERVRRYSERTDTDILAIDDGGAVFAETPHAFDWVGDVARYRQGIREPYVVR